MDHPLHMRTRRSVRRALAGFTTDTVAPLPVVLVGLSGGADSLALAAALAAEARKLGVRAGAIVVDHGLQRGSDAVAERAAAEARTLGLNPVLVRRVHVDGTSAADDGLEAAARSARYAAFIEAAAESGAVAVLTGHTRDDQSEQVLLALARGSGTKSIAGIPRERIIAPGLRVMRPFLGEDPEITRAVTEGACAELELEPWHDPHNTVESFSRVRVRSRLLPLIEETLGGGAVRGLARSADLAREDATALDEWAEQICVALLAPDSAAATPAETTWITVNKLVELPAAVRQRVIHRVARVRYGANLSREHTLAIASLVTHWRGQGPVFVPGLRVIRERGRLRFDPQYGSPRTHAANAASIPD